MSIKCVGSVLHVRSTAVITAIGRLTLHIPLKTAGSDVKLTCNIFPCAISHSTPYGPMGNGKYCFQWIIHTHSVIFQDDSLWGKKQHTLWKRKCRAEHLTAIILMNYPTCRGAIEDKQWLIVLSWGGGGASSPLSLLDLWKEWRMEGMTWTQPGFHSTDDFQGTTALPLYPKQTVKARCFLFNPCDGMECSLYGSCQELPELEN